MKCQFELIIFLNSDTRVLGLKYVFEFLSEPKLKICALNLLQEKLDCFIEGDGQDLVLAVGSAYDRLLVHGSSQVLEIKDFTLHC